MNSQTEALNRVLRWELTAVNQQFIHILALREWGEEETAARITQVDNVDFPNSMRIIDYMVETGTPIDLAPGPFVPGTDHRSILVSEQALEERFSAILERAACSDKRAQSLIAAARAPREAYSAWLAGRLEREGPVGSGQRQAGGETADLVSHLITLIEQPLVHAFVHWHDGDAAGADAAWSVSGAAMMHLTKIVRAFARRGTVPVPGAVPAPRIASRPGEAHDLDRCLAGRCAEEATRAADDSGESTVAGLCRKIAGQCLEMSRWRPGSPHPAASTNPAAFASFDGTLSKFVHSD